MIFKELTLFRHITLLHSVEFEKVRGFEILPLNSNTSILTQTCNFNTVFPFNVVTRFVKGIRLL